MPSTTWTDKQLKELKELYPKTDTRKLAARFGKTYMAVKTKATILKLKKEIHSGSPWTPKKIEKLVELYPYTLNTPIAKKLKVEEKAVSAKAFKLGLKKTKEFMRFWNLKTAFKKGDVPANKGKSQVEYMSPEAIERTKATRFKKGEIAPNKRHYKDGDITVRNETLKDGSIRQYKWIRISRAEWKMLHVVNWELEHGPVPDGYIVVFKNKDTAICEVSNLEMITLAENMARNTIQRFPVELKQTIRIIHKIKKTIKKKQDAK